MALAGIMGGFDSEVSDSTVDILIESAHFDPSRVRSGAKTLGLHTDANHRFERGADPGICRVAADRVAKLIAEVAGGKVQSGALDVRNEECEWQLRGHLSLERAVRFGGVDLDGAEVERWLTGVGFSMARSSPGEWDVEVPTWRYYDMRPDPAKPIGEPQGPVFEADFFEEVLRLHGLEGIPSTLPAVGGPDPGFSTSARVSADDPNASCGFWLCRGDHILLSPGGHGETLPGSRKNRRRLEAGQPPI